MQKELRYSGFSTIPSDYECPDGDLATPINLIPEDGALKPIQQPLTVLKLPSPDYKVIFQHKTASYNHLIIQNHSSLFWLDYNPGFFNIEVTPDDLNFLNDFDSIHDIAAIGNTITVLTPQGIHYFLWKDNTSGYKYLGNKMPECPITFALNAELHSSDVFELHLEEYGLYLSEESNSWEFSEESILKATEIVLAQVNKFIAENSFEKGRFIFPFFIRYAYRLYDGSLTMHSAPVLMVCSSEMSPHIFRKIKSGSLDTFNLLVAGYSHSISWNIENLNSIKMLEEWSDIISSVDIFISKPIYTYDQNGKVNPEIRLSKIPEYNPDPYPFSITGSPLIPYKSYSFKQLYYALKEKATNPDSFFPELDQDKNGSNGFQDVTHPLLPVKSSEDVKTEIENCASFYFLKSFNISDLSQKRNNNIALNKIDIPEDYLASLTSREVMSDDYQSHDILCPKISFPYNNRLSIADINKIQFPGYSPISSLEYTSGGDYISIFYFIKTDKDTIVRWSLNDSSYNPDTPLTWLFYPDPKAFKAVICWNRNVIGGNPTKYFEVPLSPHPFLNGAYWFDSFKDACSENRLIDGPVVATPDEDAIIQISNKIYTSEINNPFYFPLDNICSIGSGSILGIRPAAKALSQGQFGQFPLYAFTDEGVWALEVSASGTYSARQPISRDVCINPDAICQIDSAVIFPTLRGIMMISGSNVASISDSICSDNPFNILSLPKLTDILNSHAKDLWSELFHIKVSNPVSHYPFPLDFSSILAKCQIAYDYPNQRIFVFQPPQNGSTGILNSPVYAYVFSLKSKQWGLATLHLSSAINSFPEALVMDPNGNLLNLSSKSSSTLSPQLIVSRPFKLDAPDSLKTIDTIIQRGFFRKGKVKSILYASRDLFSWHLIWSSADHYLQGFRGTPYKYFRIALICDFAIDESIYGATVQFTPRFLNHPR